jgi:hypothetical protein
LCIPVLITTVLGLSGCAHQVAFQDVHYDIGTNKQDASITTVIDPDTLNRTVSVRSFMTGIANSWDVQPGEMLKQVADIELPQMFDRYTFATTNAQPSPTMPGVTLHLTIPDYAFSDFHAKITVHATAYAAEHTPCSTNRIPNKANRRDRKCSGPVRSE